MNVYWKDGVLANVILHASSQSVLSTLVKLFGGCGIKKVVTQWKLVTQIAVNV